MLHDPTFSRLALPLLFIREDIDSLTDNHNQVAKSA